LDPGGGARPRHLRRVPGRALRAGGDRHLPASGARPRPPDRRHPHADPAVAPAAPPLHRRSVRRALGVRPGPQAAGSHDVSPRRATSAAALEALRLRLAEAEQTLEAIRAGEVDSLVVEGPGGLRVYTLEGAGNAYRRMVESIS